VQRKLKHLRVVGVVTQMNAHGECNLIIHFVDKQKPTPSGESADERGVDETG
jgi:hypothetical protein